MSKKTQEYSNEKTKLIDAGCSELNVEDLVSIWEDINGELKFKPGCVGTAPKFEKIAVKDIKIPISFQRFIQKTLIEGANQFCQTYARPIVVYQRYGTTLVAIDGQHTLIMALKGMGPNFEVMCEVHEHPKDRSTEQCERIEAKHFAQLNTARKNLKKMDKIRAGLLYGDKEAVEFNNMLVSLGLFIDDLGDTETGYEVDNTTKLEWAYKPNQSAVSGRNFVKQATRFLVGVDQKHYKREFVSSSMIYAFSKIFELLDYLGQGTAKYNALIRFLNKEFHNTPMKIWNMNSSGSFGHILVARRVVEYSNISAGTARIGDNVLDQVGLSDPAKV